MKAGPESGQMLLSAKFVTFHINSYMTCGSLTGWLLGQLPPPLAPEPWPYATWDLWSGESKFLPSQHLICFPGVSILLHLGRERRRLGYTKGGHTWGR